MLRFAPSPTGDMHIRSLRVAILNYIVAKQNEDQFIVRIEDIDKERNIEGKDTEILQILEKFALPHERVFHQSENLHIHQTLAIRLLEEKKAFACTCTAEQLDAEREESKKKKIPYYYSGKCSSMTDEELQRIKEEKVPFVLRIHKPTQTIENNDIIQGDMQSTTNEVDSFVILRADSTPTYNFACACDDILTGVDFIIRGEEHLSDTAKQIHIKRLLGYDTETTYAHLPIILNIEDKKMSERDDDSFVKWLFSEGYIPDAIINYLLGLGYNTPEEIFTLPEALEWFKLENISKNPAKFDIEKLRFINREHLKLMDEHKLSTIFGFADSDIGRLAKIYLEEVSTINELDKKIKAIFAPKEFDGEWSEEMVLLQNIITQAKPIEEFDAFKKLLMQESKLKGKNFLKPLRILLTGSDQGPEISDIYPHIKSYLLEIAS